MPIYEYTCLDCGARFDALRSMSDADKPIECKQCRQEHTTRCLSVFFANSGGRVVAGSSSASGCAGCAATSCAGCGH
jgi:putative FmdB family regulatory protein